MKISVIIPMYNAEKYLYDCIESFLNNDYDKFELIIVDDSSTDMSKQIVEQFNSEKIKLLKNPNKGVSSARNFGLKHANGDFVTFCDSDDYVSKNYFQTIIDNIKDYDTLVFGYFENFYNCKNSKNSAIINDDIYLSLLDRNYFGGYVWNKVYKLNIIKNNNIYFDENFYFLEDLDFNFKYFSLCKKINVISNCLYFYRMRNNSAVNQFSRNSLTALDVLVKIKNNYDLSENSLNFLAINYYEYYYVFKYVSRVNNVSFDYIKLKLSCKRKIKTQIKYLMAKYIPFFFIRLLRKKSKHKVYYS